MGILKKLFGKKKKEVSEEPKEAKATVENKDVSLEDVNKELKDLETIEEDKKIEKEAVPSKTAQEKVKTTAPPKEEKPKPAAEKKAPAKKAETDKDVYHIKKHAEGWQVIKDGADKAYRVFQYQKEAIDFAKDENLEHIVFKADGTPRD